MSWQVNRVDVFVVFKQQLGKVEEIMFLFILKTIKWLTDNMIWLTAFEVMRFIQIKLHPKFFVC